MEFKQLLYIVAIADTGNLTQAAKRLYISQPTLSIFLKKLEAELGVSLFLRAGNRMVPTHAGELYIDTARVILSLREELMGQLKAESRSLILRLGISSSMFFNTFMAYYPEFHATHPDLTVEAQDGRATSIMDELFKNHIDIAVTGGVEIPSNPLYDTRLFNRDELCLLMHRDHPLSFLGSDNFRCPPRVDIRMFADASFILPSKETCDFTLAQRMFDDAEIDPYIICTISNYSQLYEMFRHTQCIMICTHYGIPADLDAVICFPEQPYYRYMYTMKWKNKILPHGAGELINTLIEKYLNYYNIQS